MTNQNAGSPAPASLSGVVVRKGTSQAIDQATVQLISDGVLVLETESSPQGEYEIKEISPGDYDLVCKKSEYETWTERITFEQEQQVTGKTLELVQVPDTTPPAPPSNVKVSLTTEPE